VSTPDDARHPTPEQLAAFDRGDIAEADAAAIEDHLATCPECLARLESGSGQDDLLRLVRAASRGDRAGTPPIVARHIPTGYELIEPIGRGGMGVVFKARQRALGRLVALKQIRAGLDAAPKELARFQGEAEAAAMLSHPHIVRVFDVGQQDGLPYIAMELVEGGSLADRLAGGPLRPAEAAALIADLARALQHAHENGIVHRDLKPSNILFATDQSPRIADFGLVKFEGIPGTTLSGALVGTPRYMAPEQVEGKEVGPSADIHALGVLLYECLTGRPPFQAASTPELIDQIRSREPVPPGRVQPGSPRDLQTICLKCLEKEPRRRYATAADLADDLGRFLRSEPIRARPIGPVRRFVKWVRRRPYQAALAALAALATAGALAGLLAHQARLRAEKARAAGNYQAARETIRAILDCYEDPAFAAVPRRGELLRAQSERALGFYERLLAAAESTDPEVQLDTARAAREAATIQFAMGRPREAIALLERSLRLIEALRAARPADPVLAREQVHSRTKLGLIVWNDLKDADRALAELRGSSAAAERLVRDDPRSVDARSDLAWCLHDLGTVLLAIGRNDEALTACRRAIEINRRLGDERPTDWGRRGVLAESLVNFGLLTMVHDPDRAEAAYGEAAAIIEAIHRDHPHRRWLASLGSLLNNRGNLAGRRGRADLAFRHFERGLALVEDELRREPHDTTLRYNALNLHGSRANLLGSLGRHGEAVADWDRVIELNDDPADRFAYGFLRVMTMVRTADYSRGIRDVEELLRGRPDPTPLSGEDLYNCACIYGLASAAARDDRRLDAEGRRRLAGSYADAALAWLERASRAGFFADPKNREHARHDGDLASLGDRPEFGKLLGDPSP
jgi:serine/threonine-protein kinase